MGLFASRQNATVEETDVSLNHLYKYPPRSGNYFGTHFIMGGERFDTPQPEAYLFGENADLNFLGSKPTPFPYPPPQATEPTKTLKSLVNIRKESVRFVKVAEGNNAKPVAAINSPTSPTGNAEPGIGKTTVVASGASNIGYNIEFVFDADYACLITIHYFCIEDIGPNGLSYLSRDSTISSETFRFQRGVNQVFSAPHHIVYPAMYAEDDLTYGPDKDTLPVVIHCVVGDGGAAGTGASEEMSASRQSHATICVIDHHSDGTYALRALKQKIFVDGLCYLLQEIYGIENKLTSKSITDEETEDNGSECVICMCDTRDTLILPCRHLCLCNSCADSLRYQANNCPICRAPFRALLQIRAVQKDVTGNGITCGSGAGGGGTPAAQNSTDGTDNIPAGYKTISLIEALNGPAVSVKAVTGTEGSGVVAETGSDGNRSNENGFGFRSKLSKSSTDHSSNGELANGSLVSEKSSGVATSDVRMQLLTTDGENGVSVSVTGDGGTGAASSAGATAPSGIIIPAVCSKKDLLSKHSPLMQRAPMSKDKNPREKGHRIANANNSTAGSGNGGKTIKSPSDKPIGFHLVHEKAPMKPMTELTENDDDSDVDKAAPLLRKSGSYEAKKHPDSSAMKKLLIGGNGVGGMLGSDGPIQGIDKSSPTAVITELLKGAILGDVGSDSNGLGGGMERDGVRGGSAMITIVADDSEDYYTPEDPPVTSPLKAMEDESPPRDLLSGKTEWRKPLPTGATTATVVVPPPPPPSALSVLKEESSLQGSLPDSPISGNSQTSTRSSSDSYSSSSSTRQLLSSGAVPNDTPTHALSSVDSTTTTNGNSAVSKIAECSIESD
uniref:RING-type E3 ubiquitin transferase n=1 Tax=Anopheles marajoara TaxID=58244 RepID=A0A2M4BDY2_9DIPT